jgi:hypothetical protein
VSVQDLLRRQEEGFISLHDVLTRMAELDGSSYQDAAIALHRLLSATDEDQRPGWYECTSLNGKRSVSNKDAVNAWEALRTIARHGVLPVRDIDDDIPF